MKKTKKEGKTQFKEPYVDANKLIEKRPGIGEALVLAWAQAYMVFEVSLQLLQKRKRLFTNSKKILKLGNGDKEESGEGLPQKDIVGWTMRREDGDGQS